MANFSSHAAFETPSRLKKARKIEVLLETYAPAALSGRMLEVGAGSGLISEHFSERFSLDLKVSAVDISDQRVRSGNYSFQVYDGEHLPFEDKAFDLIVSNHVIEHVGGRQDQASHLRELKRVLSDRGVVYVAMPSKWQPVEPHFGLPGLSWLPRNWRDAYVRATGKGDVYDCDPMGHREFEDMAARNGLAACNLNAEAFVALCKIEGEVNGLVKMLSQIPTSWLRAFYRASPTMVYLLSKRLSNT